MTPWQRCLIVLTASLVVALPLAGQVATAQPEILNAESPVEGVLFGGQLTTEDVASLEQAGYKSVLDLRGVGEDRGFDEPTVVTEAGMAYAAVPVDAKTILSPVTYESFFKAFETLERPIAVHCASGNRVGALYYAWLVAKEGQDREQALATARANGLRSDQLVEAVNHYLDGREP
jgi:uncharacterized protein (TIGR01244 family)